jgi:hypothetical protein
MIASLRGFAQKIDAWLEMRKRAAAIATRRQMNDRELRYRLPAHLEIRCRWRVEARLPVLG